ncbi:type VII secretion protein EsaA [Bacillus aquiflavi]|uniref:type VII secretion protein EsaA n=1 Tax=Bacillus aquiflavi TaxID=2672567 RepID=UPI001CA8BEDF|nr:type VII secretion protein EsaA [Bacillus aquiflavi]UAC47785.1 type VII secretion protein EsaA [Bacillus aquiflavi]
MTDKTKYIIKMILVVFLIIATPVLFFSSIGGNPMQQAKDHTSRTNAVVNEDMGVSKEEEALQLGNDVAAILADDSDFEWTVLSRSAAENGLQSLKYDAVVYIPSDFSTSIMTYDEEQPAKAKFKYKVQAQLNALNREKVLREIGHATNRVNHKMSSLYWNYISQDMDNIRKEFDKVLKKEIDFPKTMAAFYKPSSKNLAEEIDQQRKMLEQLRSTMKQNEESSPNRQSNVQQFEESLTAFVTYVDEYKTYQDHQQQLLAKLQEENIIMIQQTNQNPTYVDSKGMFDQNSTKFSSEMKNIEGQLKEKNKTLNSLSTIRQEQVERQTNELVGYIVGKDHVNLDKLQKNMLPLRDQLLKQPEQPGEPQPGEPQPGEPQPGDGDQNNQEINLEEERKKLLDIIKQIDTISKSLTPIDGTEQAREDLGEVNNQISGVEEQLGVKSDAYKQLIDQLKADYEKALEENNKLNEKIQSFSHNVQEVVNKIKEKEQRILASKVLSKERKEILEPYFAQEINSTNLVDITNYYSYISIYDFVLNGVGQEGGTEDLKATVNKIVSVKENEQNVWDELEEGLPSAESGMSALQEQFTGFASEYSKKLEEQQSGITQDLTSIQESAHSVLSKIHESNLPTDGHGSGTSVLSGQKGIGHELLMMNEWVNSLGQRQDDIVSYTGDLQSKVQNVQKDADTLNTKWGKNVETTKMVRDDIFNVLGNAFVDGQNNGYVYDYLANPLKIDGEAPIKKEEKKVPPVVILVIVLISSLLIGFFTHYFKGASFLVQGSLFTLLSLIVGLIISLFGLNIYSLGEERAIEWSIFTILLVTASAALIRAAFTIGQFIGWIASMALILFFVSPLLDLTVPNFHYKDPMSEVYMSIQYGTETLFWQGVTVLGIVIISLLLASIAMRLLRNARIDREEEHTNEM